MTETIAASAGPSPPQSRRLHPGLAFLGGVPGLGVGYLYVGRVGYAVASLAALCLCLFVVSWTRMALEPAGWYTLFALVGIWWLVQLVHPVVLAWSRPSTPPKPYNRWWWYLAWIVGVDVASSPLSENRGSLFGYDHYYIPSMSMAPTIRTGDRIVVDVWRYRDTSPAAGDIVVCDLGDGIGVVKRVVAVPGDTVELRGPLLLRNGSPVHEPYLSPEPGFRMPDVPSRTLGPDEFFVLGDNRGNSNDSRIVGPISMNQISARVEHIYFSSSGAGVSWDRFPLMLSGP